MTSPLCIDCKTPNIGAQNSPAIYALSVVGKVATSGSTRNLCCLPICQISCGRRVGDKNALLCLPVEIGRPRRVLEHLWHERISIPSMSLSSLGMRCAAQEMPDYLPKLNRQESGSYFVQDWVGGLPYKRYYSWKGIANGRKKVSQEVLC